MMNVGGHLMNRLKGMLCYLSGPMDRVEWEEATQWRDDIKPFLLSKQVGILDPCDKACSFGVENEKTRETIQNLKEIGYFAQIQSIMKPICAVDLRMVDIAHFLILYLDLDSHMCGSYHEAFEACSQKKPILVVCKQGKSNIPNWMFGVVPHQMMFSDWTDMTNYLEFVDTAKVVDHMNRWRFLDMDYVYGSATSSGYTGTNRLL